MPHNPDAVPDNPPQLPPELLVTPAAHIFRLLAAGVSQARVVAIGTYRGTWTADDVQAVGIQHFGWPTPIPLRPVRPLQIGTRPYCGTPRGYKHHNRNDETQCEACLAAHAEYVREWRRGRIA